MNKKPEVTAIDTARAFTNSPTLSSNTVTLGDREFTIVDLPYDDYVQFLAHLQPLIEGLVSKLAQVKGINFSADGITGSAILAYCLKSLPEMVRLSLKQTEPDLTIQEIKKLAGTPFKMANVVLKQIEQNHIINEVSGFFVQVAPLLRAGLSLSQ